MAINNIDFLIQKIISTTNRMALPFFCKSCGSLLNDINPISRIMVCPDCSVVHPLSQFGDTTVMVISVGSDDARTITDRDLKFLAGEPTISSIYKDCPSCKYNVCTVINDDTGKFKFICNACETIII